MVGKIAYFGLKTGKGLKKWVAHLTTYFEEYPPGSQPSSSVAKAATENTSTVSFVRLDLANS